MHTAVEYIAFMNRVRPGRAILNSRRRMLDRISTGLH